MLSELLLSLGVAAAAPADPSATLAAILSEVRAKRHFPGGVALVSRRGVLMASAAVGVRREGGDDAVTIDDRFHIGSVTKPMNATMIATLVDEGKLRWESTLAEMFPDWPIHRELRAVTLAQLLSHHSGLAPFTSEAELEEAPKLFGDERAQRAQFAQWLLARKPALAPGTQFSYSNAGVAIAAAAAERAANRPWERLMRERVFDPLGMKSAGLGWPAYDDPKAPWGHQLDGTRLVPQDPRGSYQLNAVIQPAGNVSLSVKDLGRFLDDQARGLAGMPGLLRPATYARMHALEPEDSSLGWGVSRRDGATMSSHAGSAETFYTIVQVSHEDGLEIAVMLNSPDAVPATAIFRELWQRFRAAAPPKPGG
jgi:CubicO group peptidase (beta-lactamase class C family)